MHKLILKNSVKVLFLLFFMLVSATTIAQTDTGKFLPNITPPSPTAGELGKFGNVPVGLFTGAANVSVPLITYKTKDLESPLSLFYGSNGIKVDEVASNVGLGWNLNFGGVITRTVRDKNDDTQTGIYTPDNLSALTEAERVQFYKAAGQDNADTESDIYSFNFNGNSGKFVYDKNGVPVMVNNQKIKIERTGTGNAEFLLTTTNGVKYYFTETETTTFRNMGAGHSVISGSVTAWYLTKIVHPNKSEIYLTYEDSNMNYTASNSQTLTIAYPVQQRDCSGSYYLSTPTLSGIVSYSMKVIGKRVNKIYSNNSIDGYVTFTYSSSGVNEEVDGNSKIEAITQYNSDGIVIEKLTFNYLKTANSRVFLQDITFLDPAKKYAFEYISQDAFPKRLSTSQDHWGYYNGKSNINLVPKIIGDYNLDDIDYNGADREPNANFAKIGLLNKIIYPTKGYTQFDYESNTYWGEKTTYFPKTPSGINLIYEDEDGDFVDDNGDNGTVTITSPINQTIKFSGFVEYASKEAPKLDANGNPIRDPLDRGNYVAHVQIYNNTSHEFLKFYTIGQFGRSYVSTYLIVQRSSEFFYFDAVAGQNYTITLSKNGVRVSSGMRFEYYNIAPETVTTNIETGGVRIKSTRDFADPSARANYKRYYYAPKHDLYHSSADKGKTPFYVDFSTQRKMCPAGDGQLGLCQYVDNKFLTVSSSSIISLFDTGSSNCLYKYVTVSEGGDDFENGGEMKEFIIDRDDFGDPILGDDIKSAPLTNFGWDNGLEIRSQIFQKKTGGSPFVVVAENENKYTLDPSYNKEVKAYSVRKNYEEMCPNAQTIENFSIVEYKTIGHWFYLESSISKKYDLKGLNPIETTTTYQYNNPVHIQLTSQSTESSQQESLKTNYYYPQDASMAGEPFVSDMIAANRIDTPLKTETFRGTTKQSEQKTEYAKDDTTANLLLPKFIYAAKFPNSLSTPNGLKRKITYDKYDDVGNILQYTLEGGTPVAIIWGYNKTKPIAKIENMAYDNIPVGTITSLQTLSNADKDNCLGESCSEQRLRNELNIFRNSLSGSFITTYTYNPLVGVTSVTDPKGMTSYYEYDTVGRLKFVKDNELNVLQRYCYNYRGQQINCNDNTSSTVILYKSIARSALFTKDNCAAGGTGDSINYSQGIGAVISDISQEDADNRGLIKFNTDGQVYANTTAKCTFWNIAKSQQITRNDCRAGGIPDSALYSVAARKYFSNTSQADADAQAQTEINTTGQVFANATAKCTFWNSAKSQLITRNNCGAGGTPDSVLYSVPAGKYFSNVSQTDSDAKAQTEIYNNGQAYANATAKCTFWNSAKSQLITRSNCEAGGTPDNALYSVPAGRYFSNISQADADIQAQGEINNNGQAYANSTAKCTFWNVAKSGGFVRAKCPEGGGLGSIFYNVPAGKYFSNSSQADADAQAERDIDKNGQAFANANAPCTYNSIIRSGSFTKNNCAAGNVGSSVSFYQGYGAVVSTNSQAEADSLALIKFNTDGQNNANTIGVCTPVGPVYTYNFSTVPSSTMTIVVYCSTASHPTVTFKFIIKTLTTANKVLTVRKSIVLGANQLSGSLTFSLGGVDGSESVELDGPVQ